MDKLRCYLKSKIDFIQSYGLTFNIIKSISQVRQAFLYNECENVPFITVSLFSEHV